MLLGAHNGGRRRLGFLHAPVSFLLVICMASPARGESVGAMMGNPAFRGVILVIAMLNKAMRDAAENPMDEWRRQNVKHAIGLLPGAIVGLAQQFQAGKFHDKDLPFVQSLLGGFVDVNAPDKYKKFLQNPDKKLIPKVGSGFPVVQPPSGPNGPGSAKAVAYVEGGKAAPGAPPAQAPKETTVAVSASSSKELATLATEGGGAPTGKTQTTRIGYDDSATKITDVNKPTPVTAASDEKPVNDASSTRAPASATVYSTATSSLTVTASALPAAASSQFLADATRDLTTIEARVPQQVNLRSLRDQAASGELSRKLSADDDVFNAKRKRDDSDAKAEGRRSMNADEARAYHTRAKPRYWRYNAFVHLVDVALIDRAAAECGGSCEGGGEGGGGQAGQILMGIAAIIAAIAPMVVASIQANADKAIAKLNADTQIKMTEITSETSKYLANQQKDIALTQSNLAAQISDKNNGAVTQRLDMQLAELRNARDDAAKAEREKRELEMTFQKERIALAKKQADDQLTLAKATLNAQLTQAGLSQGFAATVDSGSRLTSTGTSVASGSGSSLGSSISGGSSSTAKGATTGQGFRESSTTLDPVSSTSTSSTATTAAGTSGTQPSKSTLTVASAVTSGTDSGKATTAKSSILLRSISSTSNTKFDKGFFQGMSSDEDDQGTSSGSFKRRGTARKSRAVMAKYEKLLLPASGSTPDKKAIATAQSSSSDLQNFMESRGVQANDSFARFRDQQASTGEYRGVRSVTAHAPDEKKAGVQAYNDPQGSGGGHSGDSDSGGSSIDLKQLFPHLQEGNP